jgi:hypothetical protein
MPVPPGREEIAYAGFKEWRYSMEGRKYMRSYGFSVLKG